MILPTVKIADPDKAGDYIVINESDFDASKHERFEDASAKEYAEAKANAEAEAKTKGGKRT